MTAEVGKFDCLPFPVGQEGQRLSNLFPRQELVNLAVELAGGVDGEAELALGPYLSDMRNPGLDVVGALSPDAGYTVDVTGFISTDTRNGQAARALLNYLASPEAAPVYRSAKMFAASDK